MRIFVSGANGFLGSNLAKALAAAGHEVRGSVRDLRSLENTPWVEGCLLGLGDPVDASIFDTCEAVIHCAHDTSRGAFDRNVDGTRRAAEVARERGAEFQVFISSYSAHERAEGEYGTSKWTLERFFLDEGLTVVKPGLVVGNGGLFARLRDGIARYHFVPLLDGGKGPVPVVALRDFVTAVSNVIQRRTRGLVRLHLPERVRLRDLMTVSAQETGAWALRVPVPHHLAYLAIRALEAVPGVNLPVGTDSLRAFRANQAVDEMSDLHEFVSQALSLREMVRESLGE